MGENVCPVCGYDGLFALPSTRGASARMKSACAVASSSAATTSPTRTGCGPWPSGVGAGSPADGDVRMETRDDAELRSLRRRHRRRGDPQGALQATPYQREVRLCRLPQLHPRHRRRAGRGGQEALRLGGRRGPRQGDRVVRRPPPWRRDVPLRSVVPPLRQDQAQVRGRPRRDLSGVGGGQGAPRGRARISFVDGRKIIGREAAFGDAAIVQMELSAEAVPWVLDEPNPYLDE